MFYSQLWISRSLKILLSVVLSLALLIGYPLSASAQRVHTLTLFTSQPQKLIAFWLWFRSPPARRAKAGIPSGTPQALGRRGRCPVLTFLELEEEVPLTALVPKIPQVLNVEKLLSSLSPSNSVSSLTNIVWGRTVAAYPTFWFYLPFHQQDNLKFAKFVVMDENKKVVAGPILLELPDAAAVAGRPVLAKFTLPKSVQPLAIDQTYKWFFSIVCDARKPSRNPGVSGWIERVKPPYPIALYQGLPTANDYLYYAQAGLWYDTVTRIAESRWQRLQPQTKPAPSDIGKTQPASPGSLEDDWLGLFQFLFQSPGLSEEQVTKMATQVANAQIVDLIPVTSE